MSSSGKWPPIDLPPVTAEDAAALRRAGRASAMSGDQYLKFLSQFRATYAQQRARTGPSGEPFHLD